MPNVMLSLRTAADASFSLVTRSVTAAGAGVDSIAAIAEAAQANAQNYRDATIAKIDASKDTYRTKVVAQARIDLARELKVIYAELAADPELKEIYDSLAPSTKPTLVAAE